MTVEFPRRVRTGLYTGAVRNTYATNTHPRECIFSRDSRYIWVCNYTAGSIQKIDVFSGAPVAEHFVVAEATSFCISPDELFAYVTCRTVNRLYKINLSTGATSFISSVGVDPRGVSISPDNTTICVANFSSNRVDFFDVATFAAVTSVGTGTGTIGVTISPCGKYAVAPCWSNNSITLIDMATRAFITNPSAGVGPHFSCWHPNSTYIYTSNVPGGWATYNLATTFAWFQGVGNAGYGIAISPDASLLLVTDSVDGVARTMNKDVLDSPWLYVTGSLAVPGAHGVAFSPDGQHAAVTNQLGSSVSLIRVQV